MSMADLLAKEDIKLSLSRGQELTGEIIAVTPQELIMDLGTKAEGVLPLRDLSKEQVSSFKVGDKINLFVSIVENENGQVVLALKKVVSKSASSAKWDRFEAAINTDKAFIGRGIEVNRGGLMVEVGDVRGFLPSSQISSSQAADLSELIGKNVSVTVIEADFSQNRLIFSQKTNVTQEAKENLKLIKVGDKVKGKVAAVLPFGIFVAVEGSALSGVEGLVHISELAWEKVEDPGKLFKLGQEVDALVISVDSNTNRVNLSLKQLTDDPFMQSSKNYQKDAVVKGTVTKIGSMGVFVELEKGLEGLIPSQSLESSNQYQVGQNISVLIDNVDSAKRRIYLAPFITSTKDLIYK